jgi:ornithine cyclodeaminase/alanine dehydrogenase-like protein (mu-crystallin family)
MVMYLGEEKVSDFLRWDRLIAAMETALASFSLGRVLQPVRNMLTIEEESDISASCPQLRRMPWV